jgi:hypothetical protein
MLMAGTEFETNSTITRNGKSEPSYVQKPVDEMKRQVEYLRRFSDSDLKNIVVVQQGNHLEQGQIYFDLRHKERGEIMAMANMIADIDNWLVPKKEVDSNTWERLVGN